MLANVASQVQSDIDAQRDQCHALDAELARLQTEQTEKDAVYAGLQSTRNTYLLAFMKEHAMEEARRRQVIEAKERNTTQWQALVSLQAQLATIEAQLSEHTRGEDAAAAQRERHRLCLARVQERFALPEVVLSSEYDTAIGLLRAADEERWRLDEAAQRQRTEEDDEIASKAAASAAALQFDNDFDDDCLPDDILMMVDGGALATGGSQ